MSQHDLEEDGIDLDDPLMVAFRKAHLESAAKEQGSKDKCPRCSTLLPYSRMHDVGSARVKGGAWRDLKFCSICQIYFDPETNEIHEIE